MELIFGPMFSGKSTELIRRCQRLQSIGKKVIIVNSSKDTRCGDVVQTHDKKEMIALKLNKLEDLINNSEFNKCDVIAIDEGQFFEDLLSMAQRFTFEFDKEVIICGLDGDYNQKKFGQIIDLIPLSTKVDKLSGFCGLCNNKTEGQYTIRKNIDNQINTQELIGSADIYMCVCKTHLNKSLYL